MNEFTLLQMVKNGWPVLSILLVTSIISIGVIIDRLRVLRAADIDAGAFVGRLLERLARNGAADAREFCLQTPAPVARVCLAILEDNGSREDVDRTAQNAIQTELIHLERFIPTLGTIGSIAPFIGLFGTVIGIIKAFAEMTRNASGGVEVVAGGIAEALITTAFGLFVAIPAVIAYNHFASRIRRMANQVDIAVFRLVEALTRNRAGRP